MAGLRSCSQMMGFKADLAKFQIKERREKTQHQSASRNKVQLSLSAILPHNILQMFEIFGGTSDCICVKPNSIHYVFNSQHFVEFRMANSATVKGNYIFLEDLNSSIKATSN